MRIFVYLKLQKLWTNNYHIERKYFVIFITLLLSWKLILTLKVINDSEADSSTIHLLCAVACAITCQDITDKNGIAM